MFGGHGLYLNGAIVGIIVDETLYLKVDDGNRAAFEEEAMAPFTYVNKGRPIAMSYWEAPASVLEEPEMLLEWVVRAAAASHRAQRNKSSPGKAKRAKAPIRRKTRRRPSP